MTRAYIAGAVLFTVALAAPGDAHGDLGAIHPDVLRQTEAVRAAKGAEVYAALRELWRTWDRADPSQIEAAVDAVVEASTTPPPVRVYAELLSAYARRRRGDFDGSIAHVAKLGFVGRWMALGPFDNENKGGFTRVFPPELELSEPIVPGRAYDGKERPVRWRVPPELPSYGWFDFGDLVRPREQVCAYATTFVRAKAGTKAPRPVTLWMGSAGAFKLWWNGEEVLEDAAYREIDIDRFATEVTLKPGFNRVTVKACGDDEPPKFALRIADDKGVPDLGLDVAADVDASLSAKDNAVQPKVAAAASGHASASKKDANLAAQPSAEAAAVLSTQPTQPPKPKGRMLGPLQALALAAEGDKAGAPALEAYARYLAITGGDSKADHIARDLARRAAEAQPTVRRLLLAGGLAEDRNQQREWIARARKLVGEHSVDVDLLLAEAQLAQTGTNWRDAVPIYERVLAIDPDNVGAILGRVELYVAAGLKRTAIHTLEQALARQPSAVALLRAYASELRSVGRDTEASEIEARYAALRFDDSGFLSQMVDLAVARRDAPGAERWLSRLLRSEPDGAWARNIAAHTYRVLGQNDRALAAYQRALAMAPEDVPTLRALSDLYGEDDHREEQLKLLREILALEPQAKDVREYVEHIEPPKPRADEAYAWASDRFLPMRTAPSEGFPRRTLRNLEVTTVYPNGLASHFHQIVFQPLTDEAAAAGREYAFEYHGDRELVQLRAAKVYREGGKIDEAVESGEGAANDPSMAMYTSARTFYIHFPRLDKGDVVELRYRVEDTAPRNDVADYFGEIEYLQSDEPLRSSEYVLITPKARSFNFAVSPLPGLVRETKEDGERRIYRFALTDVPPISPEPASPPWSEILGHVHVSTFKTWDEVGTWYWGLAREQFDVDDEVRRKVKEITKGLTDDRSKVRAIYKYATRTRYVALEFGIEGIKPRRCAQTLARGWGDCKDKATLIVTMLREAGIASTIVLVRTGLRGEVESALASLAPFDHAIAYVPSLDLYLDGTAENTGTTELPAMDRNAVALQINEGKPKFVHLPEPPPEEGLARRRVEVGLAADGSAQLAIDMQVNGVFAADFRQRYFAEGTRRERAARDLAGDFGPVELAPKGIEVNDLDDDEQPVRWKAKGRSATFARKEGETLSLPAGPPQHLLTLYASLSTRKLDVVLQALTSREDEWVVKIPTGMKVLALPTAQQADTPFGKFAIAIEKDSGKVTVKSSVSFKKPRITPTEYTAWRSFCEAVDRAFGQRIVVGK